MGPHARVACDQDQEQARTHSSANLCESLTLRLHELTGLGRLQRNFFVSMSLLGVGDHLNVFLCLSGCPKHPRSLIFDKIINFDTSCQIRQFISSNEGREIAGDIIEITMR